MTNSGLTVRAWNDAAIARRDEDGYANATAMCQANGKLWSNYQRLDTTAAYIQALAASLDLSPADLVITTTTGPNEFRGTWIHPRLAVDLARWISPEFAVWMDGWFLEQLEHQPQAPGLTAEDVARIAMEAVRMSGQATPPALNIPALPSEGHHSISCADAIISVMVDAHAAGHRLITRRLLLDQIVKRFGYCSRTVDNSMPALIRSRQVVRHSHGRYQLSPLPQISTRSHLPPILHIDQSQLTLMDTIRDCAAQAGGPITWHDVMDRYQVDNWPGVGRVWEAMEDLAARGVGTFTRDIQTFRLAA
jgi:hypothetical protein